MKMRFPVFIELEEFKQKIIEQLEKTFSVSIEYYQQEIIKKIKEGDNIGAANIIDTLRKELSEQDFSLQNYYNVLLEYEKLMLQMTENEREESAQ